MQRTNTPRQKPNIVVTEFEPDDLEDYLTSNEIVYDKQKMNGKYQVGSGRIVTFTHDMPFIVDNSTASSGKSQEKHSDRASMTKDRIDYLIEDSGAGMRKDYAQAWITSINPSDFLNLTLTEKGQNRDFFEVL